MSQKTINVGTYPDSGNGDTIRDAMIKVNENFTEVFEITETFSSKLTMGATSVAVSGDLIPAEDLTFNLGSASNRWHSMYIGANTIYIGDNTVVSGTTLSILGDPNASSLSQMPTLVSSRVVAKPFSYTSNGSLVTVRPSIEFQANDGTSYPISFNTATNEFSLDAAGDHGTGSLVAKKITLSNTGAAALTIAGNIMQTGNFRVDGDAILGYDSSDTLTVKASTTFEGGVTLGNGGDNVTVYAGSGNAFNVTSNNFTLSATGATIPGNLTVQGNLNIQGTTTTIDSNQVNIGDNIIVLNSDVPGGQDPTENAGIQVARGTESAAKWLWDETNDFWSPMGGNMGNINTLAVGTLNASTINGNASSATKLATGRTIALTGDITGSAVFDGSNDISITTIAGTVGSAVTATTATKLATARSISLTGDAAGSATFDGSSNASIALMLATSGVTAGSYGSASAVPAFTVDAKGRITDVSSTNIVFPVTSVAGKTGAVTISSADITDATSTNTASAIVKRDASGNFSAGTITATLSGNASTATKLATARTFTLSGAVSGSASFDGSAAPTITTTLGTIASPTFTGTTNVTNITASGTVAVGGASAWTFVDNGGTLTIKYNGTTLFTLTSTGNLTVKGDITAFGSI